MPEWVQVSMSGAVVALIGGALAYFGAMRGLQRQATLDREAVRRDRAEQTAEEFITRFRAWRDALSREQHARAEVVEPERAWAEREELEVLLVRLPRPLRPSLERSFELMADASDIGRDGGHRTYYRSQRYVRQTAFQYAQECVAAFLEEAEIPLVPDEILEMEIALDEANLQLEDFYADDQHAERKRQEEWRSAHSKEIQRARSARDRRKHP